MSAIMFVKSIVIGILLKILPDRKEIAPKIKIVLLWIVCVISLTRLELVSASTSIDIEIRKGMISTGSFLREFLKIFKLFFWIRK